MELRKYVGLKIKEMRLSMGMNQERLAELLDTTKQSVSRYETGERKADQDILFKLADIFKVSIDDFFPPLTPMTNEEKAEYKTSNINNYHYLPTAISAGLPINVDGITNDQVEKISLPDSIMGKWAGKKDIFITKINGDSMDKIMPHGSLIAVKPITLNELKDGDMVVFSSDYDYSVKCFYQDGDRLIFKPESYNKKHADQIYSVNDNIEIHGKVILYIVERD